MNVMSFGNKNDLGFTVAFGERPGEGKIYLCVNGWSFGRGLVDEDVESFFLRLSGHKGATFESEALFNQDPKAVRSLFDKYWSGSYTKLEESLLGEEVIERADYELMIRAGYALDGHFVLLVPFKENEKLFIFDESDNHHELILKKRGDFFALVEDVLKGVKNMNG